MVALNLTNVANRDGKVDACKVKLALVQAILTVLTVSPTGSMFRILITNRGDMQFGVVMYSKSRGRAPVNGQALIQTTRLLPPGYFAGLARLSTTVLTK
ncbi:hypothetical protein CHS0354_041852 [Potamilus streckersoni]|uniref:Uncharacterized protein n=1 Tax=Potamilus streckersoni TaxID=2493646 RepID=A0AAE0T2E4_9BIVA|nr:hypothetical protein CHS0354_041852 [Potamilus streckersoni]